METGNIADVLSGNRPVKVSIGADATTYTAIAVLCAGLFVAILGALVIYKRL